MALLLRTLGRRGPALLLGRSASLQPSCVPMGTAAAYRDMEEFWKRNRQLNRPLSPHLSIYKPEVTSMLSLCHRVTGIAMAVTISGVSIALLALPGNFDTYLHMVKDLQLGAAILIAAKYIIAFPVTYHYINGIRHLAWDWAMGFGLQRLYKTGALATILAIIASTYFVFGL